MGLMNTIRAKYELYRLEQRYTRREKRTTFISGAQYVNGEYVYSDVASPTSSKSSSGSSFGSIGKSGPVVKVQEVFNKRSSKAW